MSELTGIEESVASTKANKSSIGRGRKVVAGVAMLGTLLAGANACGGPLESAKQEYRAEQQRRDDVEDYILSAERNDRIENAVTATAASLIQAFEAGEPGDFKLRSLHGHYIDHTGALADQDDPYAKSEGWFILQRQGHSNSTGSSYPAMSVIVYRTADGEFDLQNRGVQELFVYKRADNGKDRKQYSKIEFDRQPDYMQLLDPEAELDGHWRVEFASQGPDGFPVPGESFQSPGSEASRYSTVEELRGYDEQALALLKRYL